MFWDNYKSLCESINKSPTAVAKELGFSNAAPTHWKNGKSPNAKTLQAIADYFKVPVSRLLSEAEKPDVRDPEPQPEQNKSVAKLMSLVDQMGNSDYGAARIQLLIERAQEYLLETKELERKNAELDALEQEMKNNQQK